MAFKIEPAFTKTHGHYISIVTTYGKINLDNISGVEIDKCIDLFEKFKRDGVKTNQALGIAIIQLREKLNSASALKRMQNFSFGSLTSSKENIFQQGMSSAKQGDWPTAFNQFKQAANLGYAPAYSRVWFCLTRGRGTVINLEEGKDSLYRGSVLEDPECQYQIASCQLGTTNNSRPGMFGFSGDREEGLYYLRLAANQGHGPAEGLLAAFHHTGSHGIPQNLNEALALYSRSASRPLHPGSMNAKVQMAQILYDRKNYVEAVKHLQETAVAGPTFDGLDGPAIGEHTPSLPHGYETSQYFLGECYSNGWGVTRDPVQALNWYRIADQNGHPFAKQKIEQLQSQQPSSSSQILNEACKSRDLTRVKTALSQGARPDSQTLTWAFSSMNSALVEEVIRAGAQPDGETLTMACSTHNISLVNRAIQLGARPGPRTLEIALQSRNQDIISAVQRVGATR